MGKNSGRTLDDPGYFNEKIDSNPLARLTTNTIATAGAAYGVAALGANSYDTMVQAGVWTGSAAVGLTAIDEASK